MFGVHITDYKYSKSNFKSNSNGINYFRIDSTIILEFPRWHLFWDLTDKEQEFYAVEGEQSFLRHKYIISKALKKARLGFTSPL